MKLGITMVIHNEDDIEFVTEFPCFLGHPVYGIKVLYSTCGIKDNNECANTHTLFDH